MAGSLTLALRTAQSGLLVNQQALDIVANNIANVNSPGYSRKTISTSPQIVEAAGAGVKLAEIQRQIDQNLLKSLRIERGSLNALTVQKTFYDRVQQLFGSPADDTSISHVISEFSASLESLADAPDKSLEQSEVVRRANELTLKLSDMTTTIQELRAQADFEISQVVTEANKLITSIGDLNDKLIRNQTTGQDLSDLKDQRDQDIDSLSDIIDLRVFFRADGDAVLFTSGGRTLVDNVPVTLTHSFATSVDATVTAAEGDIGGIFAGTQVAGNDITSDIRSGKLKGLIDLRDSVLSGLQSQLDELAAETRDAFNLVHNRGAPFPGSQEYNGTRTIVSSANQKITFSGAADTRLSLFDSNGNQTQTTTVRTLLTPGGTATAERTSVVVTLGTPDVGDVYRNTINGTAVDTTVIAGETLASLTARIVSDINASGVAGAVTASVGTLAGEVVIVTDTAGTTFTTVGSLPTDPDGDGTITVTAGGPFTVDAVATAIQTWLNTDSALSGATAAVSSSKLKIGLNNTTRNLVFRDEIQTKLGATAGDATILFDANFDNTTDETVSGFSNFFGLNDFFVDGLPDSILESDVAAANFKTSAAATLTFNDSGGVLTGSPLAIAAGQSLSQVATTITNAVTNVTASVVPDGDGQRLRIAHDNGTSLVVTQTAGTLLTDIVMHVADVRVAGVLSVRSDIVSTPANIASAVMQFDTIKNLTGEYIMSVADDTNAQSLANTWTSNNSFNQAGGLANLNIPFAEYGAAIVARNASLADENTSRRNFQQSLTDNLQGRSDNLRGVNLDEELAQLILFEQAFSAAARVIATIQEMFDALELAV